MTTLVKTLLFSSLALMVAYFAFYLIVGPADWRLGMLPPLMQVVAMILDWRNG